MTDLPKHSVPSTADAHSFDLNEYLRKRKALIEDALDNAMLPPSASPSTLHEAMRYAVFTGGKRLRPILCMAACEALNGNANLAIYPAMAVEVLHTYTLVHDDLPSMDDDTTRRGKPTVHVKYGEANAILTGDALQAFSFELLARSPAPSNRSGNCMVTELAEAAGSQGVVGGQVEDLACSLKPDANSIREIHRRKTAALFRASVRMGGIAAGAPDKSVDSLGNYGVCLGLAFQIADDLLDQESKLTEEGAGETSCLAVYSRAEAMRMASQYIADAVSALTSIPEIHQQALVSIAKCVLNRST